MYVDIVDLREFYASKLGGIVRQGVGDQIRVHFADLTGCRLAGIGYAGPYLEGYLDNAERVIALMPAAQGVVNWPSQAPNAAALVDEHDLPLGDASLDRVLLVHGLENAVSPQHVLREIWRVLAPGGRLLVVVPNRRGLWARVESTPFGYGRPFSRGQLTTLLRDAMFSPCDWSQALYMAPLARRWAFRSAGLWNRLGRRLWPTFGGVIMVEATKQLYQGLPVSKSKAAQARLRPVLVPQAAPRANGAVKPDVSEETPLALRTDSKTTRAH